MADVTDIVNKCLEDEAICMSTDDNAPELVLRVRLMDDDTKDGLELIKLVMESLLHSLTLKGVAGINRVLMRATVHEGVEHWVLETEGTNLQEVLAMPGVDYTKTISNHVLEVLKCLGLEAARHVLLKELRKVIEFDGSYVNYRHLSVLCDSMTRAGQIMPITRHGINRTDTSFLQQCTFEETVDIFTR